MTFQSMKTEMSINISRSSLRDLVGTGMRPRIVLHSPVHGAYSCDPDIMVRAVIMYPPSDFHALIQAIEGAYPTIDWSDLDYPSALVVISDLLPEAGDWS